MERGRGVQRVVVSERWLRVRGWRVLGSGKVE